MTSYERGFAAGVEAAAKYLSSFGGCVITDNTIANVRALLAKPVPEETVYLGPLKPAKDGGGCSRCGGDGWNRDANGKPQLGVCCGKCRGAG